MNKVCITLVVALAAPLALAQNVRSHTDRLASGRALRERPRDDLRRPDWCAHSL